MNDVCRLMWWRSEASVLLTPTSSRSQIEQRDQRVRTFLTADQRRQLTALLRRGTVPSRDEQAAHHERLAVLAQNYVTAVGRVQAGPCRLSGWTLIAMVQTADFRDGNDVAGRGRLYGTRSRAVLAERKMRSAIMTVLKIAR